MIMSVIINLVAFLLMYSYVSAEENDLRIMGLEPTAGPLYGYTRVTVRFGHIKKSLIEEHPHPKCRFGSSDREVNATYTRCMPRPRHIGESEEDFWLFNDTCVVCEIAPPSDEPMIIPFTVSFLGDFTDSVNSMLYRYYKEPVVTWISPRYGDKDGGTMVDIYGENFVNFDQNLRCGFGSEEVQAYYVNENYMICYTPSSDIVQKEMPFSVSLNNQQNSRQDIDYVYFDHPQVSRLEPSRGPDTGGTLVNIRGTNFFPMHHIKEKKGWDNLNETMCRFGNLSNTVATVISHTEIQCVSPSSFEDREVPVEITLNNREWTNDGIIFTYYHPPFVYGISPKIGPVDGGTVVSVSGSNFEDTGYVRCKFGNIIIKGEYVNENELKCVSPKVEKPGYVKLSIAIRENEFSSGLNTDYLYYDTPQIQDGTGPLCGPESGFTQITIRGDNFADTGADFVKCVFDRRIIMNATVMSEHEMKCDSPSVLNYKGINENNVEYYDIEITLNGVDLNGPAQRFFYYKDTVITKVNPYYGPVSGNTTVDIFGINFNQTGACNTTVRFSTYELKPMVLNDTNMVAMSPKVNFTGATTVQIALNGQQFDKDITVRFRDEENTFYYYKYPLITFMGPHKGPTIGGTHIKVLGIGFDEIFAYEKKPENKKLYYKFVDHGDNHTQYGEVETTPVLNNHEVQLLSPKVWANNTVADIYISYNGENYQKIENNTFTFYVLPNITNLSPKYGPLNTNEVDKVELTLDNYYCKENCDTLLCKFKSKTNLFFEKGIYLKANTVNCTIPRANTAETYVVELSFNNGDDFTNNGFTYSFYDPYIIKVIPQMVSTKGNTKLSIQGLGFANSGENLKVRFGCEDRSLQCGDGNCVKPGIYIDDKDLEIRTYPQRMVRYWTDGTSVKFDKFAVEVSVYNDDFTNNNITIFYFEEPTLELDPNEIGKGLDPKIKKMIMDSLIKDLPANLDTMIGIPINTQAIKDSFKTIELYANYTCKYTMRKTNVTKITRGIITSIPMHSGNKNMFLCQSPVWEEVGDSGISISLNGYDYSDKEYPILFTDPISIAQIYPMCGPLQGKTPVSIIGTGFVRKKEMIFKWGVQNLVSMSTAGELKQLDASKTSTNIIRTSKFKLYEVDVRAPQAPDYLKTQGGLDYISISKLSFFPLNDYISKFYSNQYIHTNYEYYYYRQPYIKSFSPHGSVVTGGTDVLVVGAWFQYKPEYGVKPFCKFGENIVEGTYLSTVRISCNSPPSKKTNVKVPFDISLNGVDFSKSDLMFAYYNDFSKAAFDSMDPKSGPSTGGTRLYLYGSNFTKMLDPEEFLCRFKPNDPNLQPKDVPAGVVDFEDGKQAIICKTPGGWLSGSIASILITFDGQKYMDTNFKFYFYKMTDYNPKSGPNVGNGPIHVKGSGFKNSTKIRCIFEDVRDYKPLAIDINDILCPLPKSTKSETFTGKVDFGISLNGIDEKVFQGGFYYYQQPTVRDIFPRTGPSKGKGIVKVYGNGFRNDFPGVNLGCRIGNSYGEGQYVSPTEINCVFPKLILNERNMTMNFSMAMNNYSFIPEQPGLNFTPYGIISMDPSSGPAQGSTNIVVKGSGFFESIHARCRFGVDGYYSVTTAQFIDSSTIVCASPNNYIIPTVGQLPFSVPFSIAFIEDDYNPYTETTHFYSFYDNPEIIDLVPKETKTSVITEVLVWASKDKPFSMPSASVVEEDVINFSDDSEGTIEHKKSFTYLPIACKFGRFGITIGKYVNGTLIKCITPGISDDSDIAREDVQLSIALNGYDFITNYNIPFTFVGPSTGSMIGYYFLIILLLAGIIVGLASLVSQHWNDIQNQLLQLKNAGNDIPHTINRRNRYIDEDDNLRRNLVSPQQNQAPREPNQGPVQGGQPAAQGGGIRAAAASSGKKVTIRN